MRVAYDPSQLRISWGSQYDDGSMYITLGVRGQCTLTFSKAMQWFIDRAGDSPRIGEGSGVHYICWKYDTHRYKPKSPCNVVPLYQPDQYLLQGW